MEINVIAVLVATIAMFAVGGFWYAVPFGKLWGQIHGFDTLSKEEQKTLQSKVGPYYAVQALVTLVSAAALAYFLSAIPDVSWYVVAATLWLGFIVPTEVSAVMFGGTESKWMVKKIAISISGSLVCTLVGAWIISLF